MSAAVAAAPEPSYLPDSILGFLESFVQAQCEARVVFRVRFDVKDPAGRRVFRLVVAEDGSRDSHIGLTDGNGVILSSCRLTTSNAIATMQRVGKMVDGQVALLESLGESTNGWTIDIVNFDRQKHPSPKTVTTISTISSRIRGKVAQ